MVQVFRVAWVVRVVLVIKFVNAYGLHGLNNQNLRCHACDTHTQMYIGKKSSFLLEQNPNGIYFFKATAFL